MIALNCRWYIVAGVVLLSGCGAVREKSRIEAGRDMTNCVTQIMRVGLSLKMYQMDYEDKFPLNAPTPAPGWAEVLARYGSRSKELQCPSQTDSASENPTQNGYSDYWFNANLASLNSKSIAQPNSTVLLGEGNDGVDLADAHYAKTQSPQKWYGDKSSPFYRHVDGANFAYADNHAKWSKSGRLPERAKLTSQ